MLAGGEEYFQPPEAIDHDSLARFAAWCRKMRALEKPGQQSVATLAREGDAVGPAMHVKEIIAGTVMRCIKHSTGMRRYAYWCLLDKMAKDYRSTFAFLFEQQLADVAADCIEWEDAALALKYERLLEHWDTVFDKALVQQLWSVRRQERLWAAKHPEEARRQREEEEALWDREINHSHDADGLDTYGEPCLEYLKGRCDWGDNCPRLHPPGLEGSLPPESRLGDWRCQGCGMINRHFRRRCFSCVREKPQYKRGSEAATSAEARAVSRAEDSFLAPLSQQFGYDPCDPAAAAKYWSEKLATPALVAQYVEDRRRRYQSEILPHMIRGRPGVDGEYEPAGPNDDNVVDDDSDGNNNKKSNARRQAQSNPQQAQSSKTIAISAPAAALTGSAWDRMIALMTSILEEGVHAPNFLTSVYLLSKVITEVATEFRGKGYGVGADGNDDANNDAASNKKLPPCHNEDVSLVLYNVCRLIRSKWVASGKKRPHAALLFLGGVAKELDALPLLAQHRLDIKNLAADVA